MTGTIIKISSDWFIRFEGVDYKINPEWYDAIDDSTYRSGDTISLEEHAILLGRGEHFDLGDGYDIILKESIVRQGFFRVCPFRSEIGENDDYCCNCNNHAAYECSRDI